jgi:hypothetical protein
VSRPLAAALALAALALGACGGGDEDGPEEVVREFVQATNDRDSEKLCDELLSAEFIAQSTGAKEGDTAACKRQLEAVTGLRLKLTEVRETKVDGDRATVSAVLSVQGRRERRVFRLERQDGEWKLAGGSAG